MKNIVLIGMAGCGKSTIGVLLAKILGMPFIDTDLVIQEKQGRLLQEIIDSEGLQKFIHIEEEFILSLDVEGYEAEVIKGLDLDRYGPQFMIIECRYRSDIETIVCEHYKEISVLNANETYADILYQRK